MNKKKLRKKKNKITKEKIQTYIKKEKPKKLGRTVAPAHKFDHKILREGSAKLRWAGPRDLIFHSLCSLHFIYFWGSNEKERSCDGQRAEAAPHLGCQ